jgi:phosphoribosylanthranilate isomerase
VSIDEAAVLTVRVPPYVKSVGVFAGNDSAYVREAIRRCRFDILQFSGGEPPEFRGLFGKPTVFVLHVDAAPSDLGCEPQLPAMQRLRAANAAAVMADSRVGPKPGGTGVQINREVAARLAAASPLPFILAGGLTPDNVAEAIAAVRPWGVDVRSGVERNGAKDRGLTESFVREAKLSLDACGAAELLDR